MKKLPEQIETFLKGHRIAVAGVSRKGDVAANFVLRKLMRIGYQTVPINPNADTLEGVACYPTVKAIPGKVDGVVIATHPDVSAEIVRQCAEAGVELVWFHRSFGQGSVSDEALVECKRLDNDPIVGGCPLMFADPVDPFHKISRWWLQRKGTVPSCRELN